MDGRITTNVGEPSETMAHVLVINDAFAIQRRAYALGNRWESHPRADYLEAARLYDEAAAKWRELEGRAYEVQCAEREARLCRERAGGA